jgi:hypothetical protein
MFCPEAISSASMLTGRPALRRARHPWMYGASARRRGRQRRGGRAAERSDSASCRTGLRRPVGVRCGLRSRQAAARPGRPLRPLPDAITLKPHLPRRPGRIGAEAGVAPTPPRQAATSPCPTPRPGLPFDRAPLPGRILRLDEGEGLVGFAPQDAAHRRALRVREGTCNSRHRHPGRGG